MNFSKEQIEKAKSCKTFDEFKQLAKAEGINLTDERAEKYFKQTRMGELSDDDLDAVAGGKGWEPIYQVGQVASFWVNGYRLSGTIISINTKNKSYIIRREYSGGSDTFEIGEGSILNAQ